MMAAEMPPATADEGEVLETLPARREAPLTASQEPTSIEQLLSRAIDKGTSVEALEKLVTLYERMDDRRRAAEFFEALAGFQQECPPIPRSSASKPSTNRSGTGFQFRYAALEQIAETIGPHLYKHGLSYTWDTTFSDKMVHATCVLRHRNGHAITANFSCPVDASAHMNPMQQFASSRGYACRYALIQVLGLSTADDKAIEDIPDASKITRDQMETLWTLIEETKSVTAMFLKYMKIERLEDMLQTDYQRAVSALEAKRRRPQ
ncbi:MAG TPA: ERF family protein [Anaerolineae bacterium]|nr:ERF family protein [Anaerolineae bacterium]